MPKAALTADPLLKAAVIVERNICKRQDAEVTLATLA